MTSLFSGLVLGVAASGHCMAMCGPLVLMFGGGLTRTSRFNQARTTALYHAGRVSTYLLLALPAGILGQTLAWRGFSRGLAITAGVMLLAAATGAFHTRLLAPLARFAGHATSRASAAALQWRHGHPISGSLASGAANGLLPCGLVYAAVTAATAMGSIGDAALLMGGFGLGTTPALVAVAMAPAAVPADLRRRSSRLRPWLLAAAAALLIVRGFWPPATTHTHQTHRHGVSRAALADTR
jgi:sulfite exporter TauE/SafE